MVVPVACAADGGRPTLPTMFIGAGPSGVREEPPAPRAACGAVEVMEGSTPGLYPKDELVPRTGLPRSWFSVSGWGWFTWKGLTGAEAVAAPGERAGGAVATVRTPPVPESTARSTCPQTACHFGTSCPSEPRSAPAPT